MLDGIQILLSLYKLKVLFFWEKNKCWNKKSLTLEFLRNGGSLLIFGDLSRSQMLGVRFSLKLFLKERGLVLKDRLPCIFVFKPGSSFEYLGYKFIFSKFQGNSIVNQGTKGSSLYLKGGFTVYTEILVMLSSFWYRRLIKNLKVCLHQKNYYLNVDQMIVKLNVLIFREVKDLGYFTLIRVQLNRINYSCRFWFWKYLKKKYQSKPKLLSFLKRNFVSLSNRFLCKKVILLNFCEVYKKVRFFNLKFLEKNIYLDIDFFLKESLRRKEVLLSTFLLVKYEMSKDLIKLILWNKQNYICVYCTGALFDVRSSSSLIHYVPVVFRLKQLFFLYFLNLDEVDKVWFLNADSKEVLILFNLFNEKKQKLWDIFFDTKVCFYLIHKSCCVLTIKSFINEASFFLWKLKKFCSSRVYYFYQKCSIYVAFMCSNIHRFPKRMYMWGGVV